MHDFPMFFPTYSRLNYPEPYSQFTAPIIPIPQLAMEGTTYRSVLRYLSSEFCSKRARENFLRHLLKLLFWI